MNDVKEHAMYEGMDWEALESKVVVAPWTPEGPAPHPEPDSIGSSNDVYRGDQVNTHVAEGLWCTFLGSPYRTSQGT